MSEEQTDVSKSLLQKIKENKTKLLFNFIGVAFVITIIIVILFQTNVIKSNFANLPFKIYTPISDNFSPNKIYLPNK